MKSKMLSIHKGKTQWKQLNSVVLIIRQSSYRKSIDLDIKWIHFSPRICEKMSLKNYLRMQTIEIISISQW